MAIAVGLISPIVLLSQVVSSETGPKWILTINGTAGWEYSLLKYSAFTNIHGVHYDYLPWHVYLAETNGSVDVIDFKSGPQLTRYASSSRRIWISGEPYQQPQMTARQRFVLTADCQTNFVYHVTTNSNIGSTNQRIWKVLYPATNGVVRLIDENYASAVPWFEGTADPSRFYFLEARPTSARPHR